MFEETLHATKENTARTVQQQCKHTAQVCGQNIKIFTYLWWPNLTTNNEEMAQIQHRE